MSLTATFAPGTSNELVLDESNFISINPVLTHSGKADLRARLEKRRDLDEYAQRKDRLNLSVDGSIIFTGYVIGTPHNERTGNTTLRADGIFMRLEETRPDYDAIGGPVEYSSIALHDAIRDYWSRTPFTNYTVTDQSVSAVTSNANLQSADTGTDWTNVTSIPSTTPVGTDGAGNLALLQSCFTFEGEDPSYLWEGGNTTTNPLTISDPSYSGGSALELSGAGDRARYDFDLDYDIPSGEFAIFMRWEADGNAGLTMRLDGTDLYTLSATASLVHEDFSNEPNLTDPGKVSAGSHYIEFEITNADGSSKIIDTVAAADGRFSYTLDQDNGGNSGYLDGPELYPPSESVVTNDNPIAYNIATGDLTSTWNDTSNNQQIELSNDRGATYGLSASNSTSVSGSFPNPGRIAKARFTLSRYGSRTTATPQTGFNGQTIDLFDFTGDLNDLVIIDQLELTRDHFSNLQKLHDFGDFVFTVDHTSDSLSNIPVYSFQRGDETRPSPSEWDNPSNILPEVKADNYFNSVYLEGALDSTGNRPTAEVKDSTAISNDGREIQAILRDPSITTDAGAGFRANSLLDAAVSQNDLEGTIKSSPGMATPGFAYSVDFGNGAQNKTLESINLSKSNDTLTASNEFTVREGFSRDIDELKRNQRDQGDKV